MQRFFLKNKHLVRLGLIFIFVFLIQVIILIRNQSHFHVKTVLFNTIVFSILLFFLCHSLILAFQGQVKWKFFFSLFLLLAGFGLILRQSWVTEDAFVTLRHVDHFINGYGPVYNIGERVEGFSHTLWFYILVVCRWLGLSPYAALILPGLIFSFLALYVMLFKVRFYETGENSGLHFSLAVLIGISAFTDFGTSGLETSLSYLLLSLLAWAISRRSLDNRPVLLGFLLTLLILNRPDFVLFFLVFLVIFAYKWKKKRISSSFLLKFLIFPVFLAGGYQLFRLGYYAALLPNPYYVRSVWSTYFSQGLKYLQDFCQGSLFLLILVLALAGLFVDYQRHRQHFRERLLLFILGFVYVFFVIRAGGDFMHGRLLLPGAILIALTSAGAYDSLIDRFHWGGLFSIGLCLLMLFFSWKTAPVQKRNLNQSDMYLQISDDRNLNYGSRVIAINKLFDDHNLIGGKSQKKIWRVLSMSDDKSLKVVYPNIGFIGLYAPARIYLLDQFGKVDPVIARVKISGRGRPGYEKIAPFGYLIGKRLTIGHTPFPLWNEAALTPFGVVWDITFLKRMSPSVSPHFKDILDEKITKFLLSFTDQRVIQEADFMYFLKNFWRPHALSSAQALFDARYNESIIHRYSAFYKWQKKNQADVDRWHHHITARLTVKQFFKNIYFALFFSSRISFSQ